MHLTGEEFPGDDLGVRKFLSGLLKNKLVLFSFSPPPPLPSPLFSPFLYPSTISLQDFRAMVLLDMIMFRKSPSDKVFQINSGSSRSSQFAAQVLS